MNTSPQPFALPAIAARRIRQWAANALIAGLWLWLYRPVLAYLGGVFSREQFRTNQLVLLFAAVLIVWQWRRGEARFQLASAPGLHRPALALALGGSALYLAAERFLDVNTLSALLFGLATYGLLGLWMQPARWRAGLPAALLLIGALPFGEHVETFASYPLRLLTAAAVRDGLAAAGVSSIGVDTILVFENGISQVDLPCSGVKSLWTGGLFLLSATWIERRPLTLRWLMAALAFTVLLIAANMARVGVLVVVGQVAGQRLLAEMLHVPLGVLAFVATCAAGLMLLRRIPITKTTGESSRQPARPVWLAPALAGGILVLALLYAPRPQIAEAAAPATWAFPAELATQPLPLTPAEITWLTEDGAESAERRRFQWRGLSGSMILITSRSWRAHHRPERCLAVHGLSIEETRPHLAAPGFPLRTVALGGKEGRSLAAAYWFQSAQRTTDDFGARIWADLAPQRDRWVLVSVLFDGPYPPETPDVQAFYLALHDAVARYLLGW